ncbi:acyl-CoA thioesterase [Mycolicibacter arupensis]|uniref:Acyl-CoA thioesterase n=1 Tax=Mycolicibacter arupensis TaxID=342002 RepID=A0A0F5N297_9MYCO|nr:thioesterase family protein [Mycolicibacter arupensis]KKC01141.1 acyl-CoA thioesterase [Mycolicibacter arupensis]MCV7276399.1 thioesterase family protein [Mycolicibacter arupensis]ORA00713.1 acyl-CoA thioesterase [Mycolicibacter arupensis]
MTAVTASSHPFDRAVRLETVDAGTVRGATDPDWANMVGPFGGITAAALLRAVESHPDRIGDPLALTVNFAAPITDGEFDICLRAARTNRSNQHWVLELRQGDEVKTTATALFGLHRDTWADDESHPPSVPAPEEVEPGAFVDAIVWAKRYDMRFTDGPVPLRAVEPSESSTTTLWVRDAQGRALDFAALACLSDVFFPRVFLRRGRFLPAGTITLTTYFHVDQSEIDAAGSDYLLASAHANRFSRGYFDQSAHLWSRAGRLLASTHQLVYFKD